MQRKTKIIATISDQRCDVDFLASLYKAGMNVARINSAHVTTEAADKIVDNIRKVSDKIAIMIDTKGPEMRITKMVPELENGISVKQGDVVKVMGTDTNELSTAEVLFINTPAIYRDVPVNSLLLIDDGDIELVVESKSNDVLLCRVANDGVIKQRKSVNIPGVHIALPTITEKDRMFIEWAIDRDLDFIAHSFVRTKKDVMAVKDIIWARQSPIKVISKIENQQGIDNIDEILEETYGIMVARGDLGVEVPAEVLPVRQRYLVRKCIEQKAPVIIATQMLHSMMENPRPTRAEVSDIAGAVYQRADAIMLSGETANGKYPIESVETMSRIAETIEDDEQNAVTIDASQVSIHSEITAQLAFSTVRASKNLPVKAIVMDTMTGRTGRYLAAFRGEKSVFAMCYRPSVMRQLALSYGVIPMYCEPSQDHNTFLRNALMSLRQSWQLGNDDLIVVMGGDFGVTSGASFIEIARVEQLEKKVSGFLGTVNIDEDSRRGNM